MNQAEICIKIPAKHVLFFQLSNNEHQVVKRQLNLFMGG